MPKNVMTCLFLLVSISVGAMFLRADDGETRFKPKTYVPRNTVGSQAYRAPTYMPSDTPRPTGTALDAPRASSVWRFFRPKDSAKEAKQLHDAPLRDSEAFVQQKKISVPSIHVAQGSVTEQQPFNAAGKQLNQAGYQASEPSRSKNPLLKPRQGIKEPE